MSELLIADIKQGNGSTVCIITAKVNHLKSIFELNYVLTNLMQYFNTCLTLSVHCTMWLSLPHLGNWPNSCCLYGIYPYCPAVCLPSKTSSSNSYFAWKSIERYSVSSFLIRAVKYTTPLKHPYEFPPGHGQKSLLLFVGGCDITCIPSIVVATDAKRSRYMLHAIKM